MSDIESLLAYAGQLSEAAALASASAQTQRQIVNGDELTDVPTESGLVPTLAKQAVQAQEKVTSALVEVASQMAGAMTYESTAVGLLHTVDKGYFSVPSPASKELLLLYRNMAGVAVYEDSYPNATAVNDVLGLISPSSSVPAIGASVADQDGFEILQVHTDGLLKTGAFEIGKTGFLGEQLSLLSQALPNVSSAFSVMDADGFHFSLDPLAQAVGLPKGAAVLAALRASLANELEDVNVRLGGDSIVWGMTVTGGGSVDPRSHALTDIRNNLTSRSWANLLHQYLGARYSSGVMSSPAPGVALYTAAHTVDVSTSAKVSVLNVATRAVTGKAVSVDASAALEALCVVPDAHALCFETVGTGFTLVYREAPDAGSFAVLVDGVVNSTVIATNATTTYGKTVTLTLPFGRHSVELRCTGAVAFEAIQRIRRIRVANDGLIGTNTQEWLPTGSLLPASVANDDTHVIFQGGTNDRQQTTEPNDPVRTKRNLAAIADYITKVRGKSLVLMAANYADTDYPSLVTAKYSQADVARMVAQVAADVGCGYIDNYRATLKQKLAGEVFLADGLHPNDPGHLQIFKNIVDCLEQA
jgi:lysophospholipase L1-like esterase